MKTFAQSQRWVFVAVLALLFGVSASALANATKKTIATLTTTYMPIVADSESNYVRVFVKNLDKTTVDKATIQIKRGKVVFNYAVNVADIASAQPKIGQNEPKPGQINFRLPVTVDPKNPKLVTPVQTYKQGDVVTLTIVYNEDFSKDPAKGKYQPEKVVFRSGLTSEGANADESKPIPVNGFTYKLDPVYSAFDDLDTSAYGSLGARFEIRNLQFFSNVDEAFVTGFDSGALLVAAYDPTLPHFVLGSSDFTDVFPSFEDLVDAFIEPDAGMFVMSAGQIFDLETDIVVATFVNAAQAAIAEPPALILVLLALSATTWANCRRRRRGPPGVSPT